MIEQGELKAPTLHESEHGYTLDLPVKISEIDTDSVDNRVLAIDLGVKKQATATIVEANKTEDNNDEEYEQVEPPMFFDHPNKQNYSDLKTTLKELITNLQSFDKMMKTVLSNSTS